MNKRNTEGYVLAYVLVVVVVMGAIASTLMTSTLNVIKAQENSIEYMKDKYAAMGEIERLVAYLDDFDPSFLDSSQCIDKEDSIDSVIESLTAYLTHESIEQSIDLSHYPLITAFSSSCNLENNTISIQSKVIKNSIAIDTSIIFVPEIQTHQIEVEDSTDDPAIEGDQSSSHTEYISTVIGANSFSFTTYEITSNGGDT